MEELIGLLAFVILIMAITSKLTIRQQKKEHELMKQEMEFLKNELHRLSRDLGDIKIQHHDSLQNTHSKGADISSKPNVSQSVQDNKFERSIVNTEESMANRTMNTTSNEAYKTQTIPSTKNTDGTIIQPNKQLRKPISSIPSKSGFDLFGIIKGKINPDNTLFTIESLISKLGILLLLIGVGFIYKLAYDKGYITPSIVVFLGYIFGGLILGLGYKVRKKDRELLSQVLLGGGIAILYITTFAAYQGYGLMPSYLAFILLFSTSFLGFFIALSIDSMAMSIIALLGSLFTPFAVGIDILGIYGTGSYILFIGIGSMTIYVFKRWRILQLTTIIGINIITLLLTFTGEFDQKEASEFSVLLVLLFIVFYGIEYILYYLKKERKRELLLSVTLMCGLPFLTLFQMLSVLDISNTSWAIIMASGAIIYFVLDLLLYRKRNHSLITDILMSYTGIFTLIGIILYFGGEIRYIAILVLGTIFILLHIKSNYLLTKVIGLVISSIGYVWAFYRMIEQTILEDISPIIIFIRLITICILSFIAFQEKGILRKIIGGLTYQLYFPIAFICMFIIWTDKLIDPIIVALLLYGIIILLYIWLYKKFDLLSIHIIVTMTLLPFILKAFSSASSIEYSHVEGFVSLVYVLYAIQVYVLSITLLKDLPRYLTFGLRCLGYSLLSTMALFEFSVWSDHFGYGLLLFVGLIFLIIFIEDPQDKWIKILLHTYKISFMVFFILYNLILLFFNDFNLLHFIVDLGLVAGFAYFFIGYGRKKQIIYIVASLIYMFTVFQNLYRIENGTVTLFWAAYGIITFSYFLFKGMRQLVYLALGMIVLVAVKLIIIDLSTIDMLWKIITSMAFGAALLVLSYVIQPLLDKYENSK